MKPCYNCRDRHISCAGECDRYSAWLGNLKSDPAALKRQRSIDDYVLRRDLFRHR